MHLIHAHTKPHPLWSRFFRAFTSSVSSSPRIYEIQHSSPAEMSRAAANIQPRPVRHFLTDGEHEWLKKDADVHIPCPSISGSSESVSGEVLHMPKLLARSRASIASKTGRERTSGRIRVEGRTARSCRYAAIVSRSKASDVYGCDGLSERKFGQCWELLQITPLRRPKSVSGLRMGNFSASASACFCSFFSDLRSEVDTDEGCVNDAPLLLFPCSR